MFKERISNVISKSINPFRVFLALMLAVSLWLSLALFHSKEQPVLASPLRPEDCRVCSDWDKTCTSSGCVNNGCVSWAWEPCPTPVIRPPSISGTLNCTQWGTNGWCKGTLKLDLSASDPQSSVVLISGYVDGLAFACPAGDVTCSIPLPTEGTGAVNYTVNAQSTGLSFGGSKGYQLDFTTPQMDASLSGTPGTNGWFTSDVDFSVTASDAVSGLAALETSTDGGGWTAFTDPITLSDGIHTVQFRATDFAGNVTSSSQTIKVDTIKPDLSLAVTGKMGLNNWYVSGVQVTATYIDGGSGVATVEVSRDGAAYIPYTGPTSFSDGLHSHQFRVTDNAGNVTESAIQNFKVDTTPPFIDMTKIASLGEPVEYYLEDKGSGLAVYRAVIEDENEKYKKVVWLGPMSGDKLEDQILWDGKFADGAKAGMGDYTITLKIGDAAGNEAMQTSVVTVEALSFLKSIPAFAPPSSNSPIKGQQGAQPSIPQTGETITLSTGGTRTESSAPRQTQTITTTPVSVPQPVIPASGILWGAAATALVGATLADWQRQREEERLARQREREESKGRKKHGEGGDTGYHAQIQAKQMADINRSATPSIALSDYNGWSSPKKSSIDISDYNGWSSPTGMAQEEFRLSEHYTTSVIAPKNGLIGLVSQGKFSVLTPTAPVTSLGYYDLITKSYISPQSPTSTLTPTSASTPTLTAIPDGCKVPYFCTPTNTLIPTNTLTPTWEPFGHGPAAHTAVAWGAEQCFGHPELSGVSGCGELVDMGAQGLGLPEGVGGQTFDKGVTGIWFLLDGYANAPTPMPIPAYPTGTPSLTPSPILLTPSPSPTLYLSTPTYTTPSATPTIYWTTP